MSIIKRSTLYKTGLVTFPRTSEASHGAGTLVIRKRALNANECVGGRGMKTAGILEASDCEIGREYAAAQ